MKTIIALFFLTICATTFAQIPSYVPSNGLVGWWPFNGNANDESGNGYHFINTNVTFGNDRNNNPNSAALFSGSNSQLVTQTTFSQFTNAPQQSYSFWFKNVNSNWRFLMNYANASTTRFSLCPNTLASTKSIAVRGSSGCLNCGAPGGGFDFNSPGLQSGWHHILVNIGATSYSVFYDGVNIGTQAHSGFNCLDASFRFILGNDILCSPEFYNMMMDDIAVWNRELTPTEITNLYNSINTPAPTVSVSPSSTTICPGTSTTLTASTSGSTACSSSGLPTSLQTGLVGYWPFCGNANDASGNGNNGTVNGATLTTDRFGNSGSAYSFNGSSNYIDVGNNNSLNSNIVTISAWYIAVDYGSSAQVFQGNLVSKREQSGWGGAYQLALISNPSNLVWATYTIAGQNGNVYSTLQPLGQWIHVVYVHDLNSARIYINGVLSGTTLVSGGLTSNNLPVWFGARPNAGGLSHFFNGILDDIAIWNRALTASEIQQLYTASNATYSWSPGGATTQSITVSPTTTTTYTVTATANGQSSTSTAVVTVTTPPTISASSSSICAGQSTTLTAASSITSSACPTMSGSLNTGLVGFWPFCGNANDASGNGNNGTVNGATLTADRFGNASSAYSFDGVDDYISLGAPFFNGNTTVNQFSYSVWLKLDSYPLMNNTYSISTKEGYWRTIDFNVLHDGAIHFGGSQPSPQGYFGITSPPGSVGLNNWSLINISFESGLLKLSVNGQLVSTTNVSYSSIDFSYLPIGNSTSTNLIGAAQPVSPGLTKHFDGTLDDFGIWNRALTTAEIQQLYTQGQTTYSWSTGGATTPSITVSPTSTTTYTCTVTANGTACSSSQTITVNPLPVASISPAGPVNLCQGQSVTLCAPNTPGLTYLWCNASTTSCITTNFAGNYCLVITDANGCSSNSVSTIVNVAPLPTVNAGPDFTKTCVTNSSGSVIGMTSVAGNTYAWSPTAGLSSAGSANPTANPTATTTYTLTATNTASGCTATDQVLVTVNTALPTVNAGLDQTLCQGASTVLNASSNGSSLNWDNGVQNNISFVPSTVGTITYTATATGSNGCAANDNVVVTVNPLPSAVVTTNGTSSFCPGSSVQLCAPTGTGYSYLWSGNLGTTQCVTISSSATTSVTVTNAFNCSATSAPQQVTVFNNPVASAGLDASITCVQNASGAQIGDVPNPTYTYSWTPATGLNSATIGNPIANPSTTTTYTLTVVNADGCMGSDQVTVTVNNTPPTANAGIDQSICLGGSLVLQGSTNGASGTWNNGVTNGISFIPSQTGTTTYTYSSIGANGCVNNDQVDVTVNALPVANAGQGGIITCVQNVSGVQLGANPISGNTYTWTPTSGLNNTNTANPIATPNATTTYTLLMSDANGCSDTAQVVVTVNNNPPIVAAGNDANVCNGDSFYLLANATAGSTVVWNGTIQNGSNILPAQSGYQVATATAANGCTADDSLLISILQPTTSTLNEVACDEFVLNGNVYIQTGTYTQLITNAVGCDSTITLNLTINLSPATPVVYVQNEVNLSTDIVPGQTYQWIYCSDIMPVAGATNPTFNPTANAIYAVVVTNNCGSDTSICTAVSTIGLADQQQSEIAIYPNPNNGHFTILLSENNGSAKLEVLDLNGRIIFESILGEQANELHLESLSSGTYWLRINQQVPVPVTKY